MTPATGFLRKLRLTLEMIKFEHSVFALPFALTGALLAVREDGFATPGLGWKILLDRRGDGRGAFGGDGLQPCGRCRHRRAECRGRRCGIFPQGC